MLNLNKFLFVYFLLGTATSYFAYKSKRNPYIWFFVGVFLGVCGLITLAFLNYKDSKKELHEEKLNKTKNSCKSKNIYKDSKFWYYLNNKKERFGPISFNKIENLFLERKITQNTYVWNKEFENWKFLKDINEYKMFLLKKLPTSLSHAGNKPTRSHFTKTKS